MPFLIAHCKAGVHIIYIHPHLFDSGIYNIYAIYNTFYRDKMSGGIEGSGVEEMRVSVPLVPEPSLSRNACGTGDSG